MKIFKCLTVSLCILAAGCATNPNKAKETKTELQQSEDVGGGVNVGRNDKGEVVTSRKQKLADQLRELQTNVYQLESDIYGHEEYGRKGLYGVLRDCYDKGGELKRMPSKSILTKNEDSFNGKMVIDEKNALVNVNEEYFLDRIKRFQDYKDRYEQQKDDFEEKLRVCEVKGNSASEAR